MEFAMKRRDFLLGIGAATAWPLRAQSQQTGRRPVIAVAAGFNEAEMRPLLDAFREGLQAQGWTVGTNITMDVNYASGAYTAEQAGALVAKKPDVIVTQGTGMLNVVRKATQTVPIVFTMVPDPVKLGIVDNLARPGGNVTGFTNFEFSMGGKWLELLKELQPSLKRVLQISNPLNPNNVQFSKQIEGQGRDFGLDIGTAEVRNGDEIAAAITKFAQQPNGAVLVLPDSLLVVNKARIFETTTRLRMPGMYPFRVFSEDGGLISYGPNFAELFRQAAGYVDRILKGEKPGELPVQAPTKFEFLVNMKTARAIGLEVSPLLLARADEVFE
jgi:putative tryptophan/tyrosine transport system substrate-binding protein